jgi:hypothetical protein
MLEALYALIARSSSFALHTIHDIVLGYITSYNYDYITGGHVASLGHLWELLLLIRSSGMCKGWSPAEPGFYNGAQTSGKSIQISGTPCPPDRERPYAFRRPVWPRIRLTAIRSA